MQGHDPVNASGAERWPATSNFGGCAGAPDPAPLAAGGALPPGRGPRGHRWLLGTCIACFLLAGCASAAFATAALWQLGSVVDELVKLARSTPAEVASPRSPLERLESTPAAPRSRVTAEHAGSTPPPLDGPALHANVVTSRAFEAEAEASEKVVSLGAEPEPRYVRTECNDVFVYIVSTSEAPAASAASLAVGKASPARFRRPGQSIGDWEVLAITDDWSGVNPGVWLLKDDAVCRAELAGNPARVHVPLKQVRKRKVTRRRRRGRR